MRGGLAIVAATVAVGTALTGAALTAVPAADAASSGRSAVRAGSAPRATPPPVDDPFYAGSTLRRLFSSDARRGQGQWGLRRIGAARAWAALPAPDRRWDSKVAVVDEGVDLSHEDLDPVRFLRVPAGTRYAPTGLPIVQDPLELRPTAPDGHGTAVAGVIGATANNGIGMAGVNPQAQVLALGATNEATTASAIRYAVDQGATIVNLSIAYELTDHGGGIPSTPRDLRQLTAAIEHAERAGVLIVAAAGNEHADVSGPINTREMNDPRHLAAPRYSLPCRDRATFPNLLCVAATDGSERLSPTSNWGDPEVQVAAPGTRILAPTVQDAKYISTFPGARPDRYRPGQLEDPGVGQLLTLRELRPGGLLTQGTFDRSGTFVRRGQTASPYALEGGTSLAVPIVVGGLSLLEACLGPPTLAERRANRGSPWYGTLLDALRRRGVRKEFRGRLGRRTTPLAGRVAWGGRIDLDLLFTYYASRCVPRPAP